MPHMLVLSLQLLSKGQNPRTHYPRSSLCRGLFVFQATLVLTSQSYFLLKFIKQHLIWHENKP